MTRAGRPGPAAPAVVWPLDNEQWHLLILEEMIAGSGERSWLLYVTRPAWSYRLNADDYAREDEKKGCIGAPPLL